MIDIKFISHFARNTYFYLGIFLTLSLVYPFETNFSSVFFGWITALVTIFPVYLFNDYEDRVEDQTNHKPNIYLKIKQKEIFWSIIFLLLLLATFLTLSISNVSFLLLLALYEFNYVYSGKSLRGRDKHFLRELTIFTIYIVKAILFASFFNYPLLQIPLLLLIMVGSFIVLILSIYKRYLRSKTQAEYLFLGIFTISWIFSMQQYPKLLLLIFPLLPIVLLGEWKYKGSLLLLNATQLLYFIYAVIVYIAIVYF